MRSRPKVYASHAAYIDPATCDSIVAYSITSRRRLNASIDLSDCNRKINWYFENDINGLKKIDQVIGVLTAFRRDFVRARAQYRPRRKRRS